jgi:hypothetical protein
VESESGSQQPLADKPCPSCAVPLDETHRYCPACGRASVSAKGDQDIANWVRAGWMLFLKNVGAAVSIPLILIVPAIGGAMLWYASFIFGAIVSGARHRGGDPMPIMMLISFGALVLLGALLMPALQTGVYACFLRGIRTGSINADSLWTGFLRWWSCSWVSWVVGITTVLCIPLIFLFLLGIPLIVALFTVQWLALIRIADRGVGGMEALSFSFRVLHGRLWMMLLYSLIVITLMNAGLMAFYLGIIITMPIGIAALTAAYDELSERDDAGLAQVR